VINGQAAENWITELMFLRKGFYDQQLKACFEFFSKDQVMVLFAEELSKQPVKVLNRVLAFVRVKESDWDFLKFRNRNVGVYREKLDGETRRKLKSIYDPHNRELEKLIGVKLDW
jgi:hypothetical protein